MAEENKEADKIVKYGRPSLSVSDLDSLKDAVLNVGTGTWSTLVSFVKLLAIGAYFIARKRVIEEEILIERNQDRSDQINDDRDDVDTNL